MGEDQDVTISLEEYNDLLRDHFMIRALNEAGVDNWENYYSAVEEYERILEVEGLEA